MTFPKNTAAGDVIFTVEISTNLIDWTKGMASLVSEEQIGEGLSAVTYQSAIPDATEVYMRLKIKQQ